MVYDITDPFAPSFVQYLNNRDFGAAAGYARSRRSGCRGADGDRGVEESDPRSALLVVANEVSGTTTLFRIERVRR